ncbi:MAG: 5-formyltetrahydrofolate cyclo-ligase [Ruminococcus sp.]|nr:5-formyltetrahydrofolate cyclo-ligase [Ruminococcus sp.]
MLSSATDMKDKKYLRKYFSDLRKAEKNNSKDIIISEKLLSLDKVLNADNILIYASFGSEINTWDTARRIMEKNIPLSFPKCGENGLMSFHTVSSLSDLRNGKYGIKEPDISLQQPVITDKTVRILPALALTEKGERLGYGGGYYDRFLADYPQIFKIAMIYEKLISDSLPSMPHDVRADCIITEERTININE